MDLSTYIYFYHCLIHYSFFMWDQFYLCLKSHFLSFCLSLFLYSFFSFFWMDLPFTGFLRWVCMCLCVRMHFTCVKIFVSEWYFHCIKTFGLHLFSSNTLKMSFFISTASTVSVYNPDAGLTMTHLKGVCGLLLHLNILSACF